MRLDYGTEVKVHITMPKHIDRILKEEAEDMDSISETPESNHLFTVREGGDTLTVTQDDWFQNFVAKIFFVSCRSRPDLKEALDFLTTRVRNPDGDDKKNIVHTINYIRAMQGMDLTLEVESMNTIRW